MIRYLLPLFAVLIQSASPRLTLKNDFFKIDFDRSNGSLSAWDNSGKQLFSGALNAVIEAGQVYVSDPGNYTFRVRQAKDQKGNPLMVIYGTDRAHKLDFNQTVTLFSNVPAIGFEVVYKNVFNREININSLEPLRITGDVGKLIFSPATHCLTDGAMYYDAGTVQEFGNPWLRPEPYGETKGGVMNDTILTANPLTVRSWWNVTLFSGSKGNALTAGYLINANTLGRLQVLKGKDDSFLLVAESVLNQGFMLKPGQEVSSDPFALVKGKDLFEANDQYAGLMKEKMNDPVCSAVNGWCNWFYTMDLVTEDEILANAVFAAKHLKPYGLEYIQIDEGYQTTHGDWQGNTRFPHGLKWLCDSIRSLGLKPGIWIAPFVISEGSELFKNHPGWLLKDGNGSPVRIGPWPSEETDWFRNETPKRYCLDITNPGAEKWYSDLIDTVAGWGFSMIKVDFVAWTVFSAHRFSDPGSSPAMVYRHALEIMRRRAGPDCHILDCGPGHVTGGYINSMRIEYDQNYGYGDNAWMQYFGGKSCSAGAAGKRWFYNNRTWTNDIDHLCIDLLQGDEPMAAATIIGLSGGNVMSGDRLPNIDLTKLEILKKIFPSTPETAIPADLYENDPPAIFNCIVERDFGKWNNIAFFNTDREKSIEKGISLQTLGLDTTRSYLAFDFWRQRFAGEVNDTLRASINPGSTVLYSLREKSGIPQVIGTNRHVKQGAVELAAATFDSSTNILSVTSLGPVGSSHSVFIYLPDGFDWQPRENRIYDYDGNITIRKTEPNIVRADIRFEDSDKIGWNIKFVK